MTEPTITYADEKRAAELRRKLCGPDNIQDFADEQFDGLIAAALAEEREKVGGVVRVARRGHADECSAMRPFFGTASEDPGCDCGYHEATASGIGLDVYQEIAELRAKLQRAESELRLFDEEFVCPECGYAVTEEFHHEDDFSSRRCCGCGFVGEPGEGFPTVVQVRTETALLRDEKESAEQEAERLRAELEEAEIALRSQVGVAVSLGNELEGEVADREGREAALSAKLEAAERERDELRSELASVRAEK